MGVDVGVDGDLGMFVGVGSAGAPNISCGCNSAGWNWEYTGLVLGVGKRINKPTMNINKTLNANAQPEARFSVVL